MIKEIEFIDTAGSCLIDESNVFNDEYQSIFQIQCTKLLGRGDSALKIPPPAKSFFTKISLFSVVSNWYPCNSTTIFATASDVRDGKNDHGCWFPGEHWKLGIRNRFCLLCCLWNDPCSQRVRIFVFNYEGILQFFNLDQKLTGAELFYIISFLCLILYHDVKKKCPVKTIWVNHTILATNPIQWIYKLLAFRWLSW